MLISRFLRVCGFVVFRHLPTLDFVSRGLVFVCSRCLKMCVLWWFRADFTIFVGVWFCCFSTSTDVGFCLTRFSIRMFALPENVRSWWDWPSMFLGHLI